MLRTVREILTCRTNIIGHSPTSLEETWKKRGAGEPVATNAHRPGDVVIVP